MFFELGYIIPNIAFSFSFSFILLFLYLLSFLLFSWPAKFFLIFPIESEYLFFISLNWFNLFTIFSYSFNLNNIVPRINITIIINILRLNIFDNILSFLNTFNKHFVTHKFKDILGSFSLNLYIKLYLSTLFNKYELNTVFILHSHSILPFIILLNSHILSHKDILFLSNSFLLSYNITSVLFIV